METNYVSGPDERPHNGSVLNIKNILIFSDNQRLNKIVVSIYDH